MRKDLYIALYSRPLSIIALVMVISIVCARVCMQGSDGAINRLNKENSNIFISYGFNEGDAVILEGKINEITPKMSGNGNTNYIVNLTKTKLVLEGEKVQITRAGETIQVMLPECSIRIGQKIRIEGRLSYFAPATNWGEFDAYSFYSNRGIICAIKDARLVAKGERYSVTRQYLWELRENIACIIDDLYGDEDGAILKAMLLGIKNEIPKSVKESFQKSGIAHILAISGLHISFFGVLAYKVLGILQLNNVLCAIGSGSFLAAYIAMVGFSASAMRAGIMFLIYVLAKITKRSYDMVSSMSASSIIILSFNPWLIYDSAFLLSFSAIIGIGIIYKLILNNSIYLKEMLKMRDFSGIKKLAYNRLVVGAVRSIISTSTVFAVTLPVLLYSYYEVALYSIFLNIVILPFMPALLVSGVAAISLTGTVTGFGMFFVKISRLILLLYKTSCTMLENTGLGRINIGRPEFWQVVIYYIFLLMFCLYRLKGALLIKTFCVLLCCIILRPVNVDGIYMLDVGQGDGIVIINEKREAFVIDGGSSSRKNIGENVIIPFLKSKGVNEIKGIFITHPDLDHMNGILEIISNSRKECIRIHNIYVYGESLMAGDYRELQDSISDETSIKIQGICEGYSVIDKEMRVECIYPKKEYAEDSNNNSLVLKIDYKGLSMLETGDVESKGEQNFIGKDVSADVLKIAHHGSSSSSSVALLNGVNPKIAIISAGRNNSYGHPHEETLHKLQQLDIPYLCTKEVGAMHIYKRNEIINIETYAKD